MRKSKYRGRSPKLENVHSAVPRTFIYGNDRMDFLNGVAPVTRKIQVPVDHAIMIMPSVELRQVAQNHEPTIVAYISPTSCDRSGNRRSMPRHVKAVTSGLDELCGAGGWRWLPQVSGIQCVKLDKLPLLFEKPDWLRLEEHDVRATAGTSSSSHLKPQDREDREAAKYMGCDTSVGKSVNTGTKPSRTHRCDGSLTTNEARHGSNRVHQSQPQTTQIDTGDGFTADVEDSLLPTQSEPLTSPTAWRDGNH